VHRGRTFQQTDSRQKSGDALNRDIRGKPNWFALISYINGGLEVKGKNRAFEKTSRMGPQFLMQSPGHPAVSGVLQFFSVSSVLKPLPFLRKCKTFNTENTEKNESTENIEAESHESRFTNTLISTGRLLPLNIVLFSILLEIQRMDKCRTMLADVAQ
jgi:hypothetical protein